MSEQTQNILPEDEEVVEVVKPSKKKQRSLFFRLLRLLFRGVFLLALLLLALRMLISIPYVQNELVHWATSSLSERLNTKVEIDKVQLDFFDHFDFNGIYIQDLHEDTLLYTEHLHIDIKLFSLFQRQIVVEDVAFENTRFNFYRYPREYFTEIGYFIQRLIAPSEPGPKGNNPVFYLDCKEIFFENLRFGFQNAYGGDKMLVYVTDLSVKLAKIDFYHKRLAVESIVINNPRGESVKAVFYDIPASAFPIPNPADTIVYPIDSTQVQNWRITVGKGFLNNGSFKFDNLRHKNYFELPFDLQHFDFEDINLEIENAVIENFIGRWKITKGSLREKRGFEVKRFQAKTMMLRSDTMALYGVEIRTADSYIGDTIVMAYQDISDMGDFVNQVRLDIRSKKSVIAIKDLLVFAPQLHGNAFFRQNKTGKLLLNGRIYDRVNRLKGDDLYLSIGQNATIKGSFRSREFMNPDETLLQLNIDKLNTNMKNIKLMFPNLDINDQFYKLGNIYFQGKFDGFYYDFVADGTIKTDLGRAEMSLNFKTPTKVGRYSGKLNLYDFDLKEWTNNPDFGKVTFKSKVSGTGGSLAALDIKIDSDIESFVYKKYRYENILIKGTFNKKSFIGEMGIEDGNIDLVFNGEVNFNDKLPKFDLTSTVSHLDLKALNLAKKEYIFNTQLNLNFIGDDLDNIVGQASIKNLRMTTDKEIFLMDSLVLRSSIENNFRKMTLNSEILSASLEGNYRIKNIEKPILNFFAQNYPAFAQKINIRYNTDYLNNEFAGTENFIFKANVFDTKNATHLLDEALDTIRGLSINADFNAIQNNFKFNMLLPIFTYKNLKVTDLRATSGGVGARGNFVVNVKETQVGNLIIPPFTLENVLNKDTISFKTAVSSITDIFSAVNIKGQLFLTDNQFQIHLDSSDLKIADERWDISNNNFIQFGKGYIHTNNFILSSEEKSIALNSIGDKGVQLDISNLPITWLDQFFTIPFVHFDGKLSAKTIVNDFFNIENDSIQTTVKVDSFYINNDYFGKLDIAAHIPKFKKPLYIDARLEKMVLNDEEALEAQSLTIEGKYILPFDKMNTSFFTRPNTFNLNVKADNLPFKVAEYFVQGISGTIGKVSADLIFTGDAKQPKAKGNLRLTNAGTKVDYLQTFYRMDDVSVTAKDGFFDFTGGELIDKFGNVAVVTGGIRHNYFKDYMLDLKIYSSEFLLIDTEKKDNDLFYGRGIGSATVEFSGSLQEPNIEINATTSRDSWMSIPLMGSNTAKAANFIEFVNQKDTAGENNKNVRFFGANLKLELNVTPQAEVSLIFDESEGDVMRGRGRGNLGINVTNKGEFTMYGTYELETGEYLFTYNNSLLRINKPFVVRKGGTITWNGDPYTAQINIDAVYKGLRTAPYNLILEYLTSDEEKTLAERATDIDLLMALRGDLMKPNIEFDIQFPNVSQRLLPYIDSKMRIVRADINELNRQVFGLVVFKAFLPNDGGAGLTDIGKTYANTVTEMLSNQLSLYVTGLVSDIVTDVDFLSGVDFDFNYQPYTDVTNAPDYTGVTSEFQFNTQSRLFNDKVLVGAGGGVENSINSGTYFTGDFMLEWVVSKDGRLSLKAYRRTDRDLSGSRNKMGIGVSYSIEFDSFSKKRKEQQFERQTPIKNPAPAPETEIIELQ